MDQHDVISTRACILKHLQQYGLLVITVSLLLEEQKTDSTNNYTIIRINKRILDSIYIGKSI